MIRFFLLLLCLSVPALAALTARRWDDGYESFPPTSLQVSNVHAGTGANNVIPGELQVLFNLRYNPTWSADALVAECESILAAHGLDPSGPDCSVHWHRSGEPFYTPEGPLRAAARAVLGEFAGGAPEESTGGGTSDARFIAPLGAHCIEIGPVNASIHKVDEHVRVADLERIEAAVARHVDEHARLPGDLSFYNILHVLLRNRRIAIIIEDAHFCDELSWAELNLILNGKELDVSVLLTMRSNNIKSSNNNNNGVVHSSFATSSAGSFSVHSKSQSQADMSTLSVSNMNTAINSANNANNNNNNIISNTTAGIASVPSRDSLNGDNSNTNSNGNNNNSNNRNGGADTPSRNGHRNSVLVSAISVSRAVSIDASAPALPGQVPGQLLIPQTKPYAGSGSPAHSHHSHHQHQYQYHWKC